MSKRITAFFISLCLFILMATPMAALAAEEMPAAESAETVSGNGLGEPGGTEEDPGTLGETAPETGWIRVLKRTRTQALLCQARLLKCTMRQTTRRLGNC